MLNQTASLKYQKYIFSNIIFHFILFFYVEPNTTLDLGKVHACAFIRFEMLGKVHAYAFIHERDYT